MESMNESRLTGKVGLFVVVGLIVLALLLLSFSKGVSFFTPTYTLRLKANSVGGLKGRSFVQVSGVTVGSVVRAELASGGKGVTIVLKIDRKFQIHGDARFAIEQVGFLGDQFVAVYPGANAAPVLQDGQEVTCDEPFNIQEAARAALGFIKRVDETVKMLNEAISRVRETVLNDTTLTNLSAAARNIRVLSERALTVVDGIGGLVDTNTASVNLAVSNIVHFSTQLNKIAGEFGDVLMTNRADITVAVKDVKETASVVKGLARELEAGKGLAGSLIKDEELKRQVAEAAANLNTLSSNLSKYGILHKPKPPKAEAAPRTGPQLGRRPF